MNETQGRDLAAVEADEQDTIRVSHFKEAEFKRGDRVRLTWLPERVGIITRYHEGRYGVCIRDVGVRWYPRRELEAAPL